MSIRPWVLGALVVALVASAAPVTSHPLGVPGPRSQECGGFAPFLTTCLTGPHAYVTRVEPILFAAEDYTGVLITGLQPQPPFDSLFGSYVQFCLVRNGSYISCVEQGQMPPRFIPFQQSCESRDDPGTLDPRDAVDLGGRGLWLCATVHV